MALAVRQNRGATSVATPVPTRRRSRRHGAGHGAASALLLGPFLLLFVGMYVLPIGYAGYLSLFAKKAKGLGLKPQTIRFVGLDNYQQVITDPNFRHGVLRVLGFGLVQVPVMLVTALILALLLDSTLPFFRRLFRFSFFLPYGVPGVVAALMWGFLYSPGISPIVKALKHTPLGQVNFLGNDNILWSIANISTWQWTGYNMLIIFAALQALPHDLYEAARVDGASGWRIARSIKVPLIKSSLILTGVFSIIGTLQLFNEPQLLRSIAPSISSTYTPNLMAFTAAFVNYNNNYSAAIAVTLAVVTAVLSFGLLRFTWRPADRS